MNIIQQYNYPGRGGGGKEEGGEYIELPAYGSVDKLCICDQMWLLIDRKKRE